MLRTPPFRLLAAVLIVSGCGAAVPAPPANVPHTFVPIAGSWTSTVEDGRQTMTMDGTTRPSETAPHPMIGEWFGAGAATFARTTTGPDAFPLAIAHEVPAFQRGTLSLEFKLIGGKSDQIAGVVFNLKSDGSYNFARYNTKDGNVAIWKVQDGKREALAHGETHRQLPLGQWHDLVVTIDGARVTAAAAHGALTVSHTLPAAVDGRVGFWTKADSVTAFRGLTVVRP